MDRAAADTALRYEPVGAFLVRMCSEPGLFAISCRTSSTDLQEMHLGSAAAHGYASSGACRCLTICVFVHVLEHKARTCLLLLLCFVCFEESSLGWWNLLRTS